MLPSSPVALKPATIVELHNQAPSPQECLPLVSPVATADIILRAWRGFHELKLKLLDTSDFQEIHGVKIPKKSAFRKLALAYGISTDCVREDRIEFKDSTAYLFTIKAISPSGRFMVGSGSCHTDERRFTKPSDCRATAETRATSRAIGNLLGWAQVSVEEVVSGGEVEPPARTQPQPQQKQEPQSVPPETASGMTRAQRSLLVSLINSRIPDNEERETALQAIESYSKDEAHDVISSFLTPA